MKKNNKYKKVFITGGGGYVGSALVPLLIKKKYKIIVYDTFYYGNFLNKHKNLKIIKADIRDIKKLEKSIVNCDYFIHLACISNDASFVLDKKKSEDINYNCFESIVKSAKKKGVKRFIYASTSSVYGVSKSKNVRENHKFKPLTLYNKLKGDCEPILNKFKDENFTTVTIRPATVCGYAPRLRLDVSVNILTFQAFFQNEITIFGGKQLRPNINVKDMIRAYVKLLNVSKNKIQGESFNCGFENLSIEKIAFKVKKIVERKTGKLVKIKRVKSNDLRSYHINSDKIKKNLGFKNKYTIEQGVVSLIKEFQDNYAYYKKNMKKTFFYNVEHLKRYGF